MLKELALSQYGEANPVCEIPGYRSSILRALKTLEVLDGLDQSGNQAAVRDNLWSIPGTISDKSYLTSYLDLYSRQISLQVFFVYIMIANITLILKL